MRVFHRAVVIWKKSVLLGLAGRPRSKMPSDNEGKVEFNGRKILTRKLAVGQDISPSGITVDLLLLNCIQ